MADDFDVEAMLEAPFRQDNGEQNRSSDRDRDRDKGRKDRDGHSRRDRDRHSHRDKDKERRRSRDRGDRDRDRRRRSRDKDRERRRGGRSRSRDRDRRERARSPSRMQTQEISPEEKDARTVFCMQMAARIRPRDLEDFFSSVGKVRDVRIIMDNKTRKSKGISYVEFAESESVPLALGLTGQKLLGVPIIVQASQAEKSRSAMSATAGGPQPILNKSGPMRLYVGSLHFNISEDMLRGIFDPFGKVDQVSLVKDNETGKSKGFGFVTFGNADDAKKALDQLNGFELAGRPMKVGHVTERSVGEQGQGFFDHDEMDRAGVDLGATGRLQLMAKLAEGTGFQIPQAAANALQMQNHSMGGVPPVGPPPMTGLPPPVVPGMPSNLAAAGFHQAPVQQTPPIATQCFMLSNMFEPNSETSPTWEREVRDDVIEECNKHGGVLHLYVDKASPQGNVYVKCPTISAAVASVAALHGRFFAGRIITAAYVPLPNYHQLFSDSQRATQLLMSTNKNVNAFSMPPQPYGNMGLYA